MLVEKDKPIDEIVEYFRQNSSNSGEGNESQIESNSQNGPNQQSSVIPDSSQTNSSSQLKPIQHQQVKLLFIFEEENDAYYKALENKEKFNHDFVKKFRDHILEKHELGTISVHNTERALKNFYFEAE